MKKLIGSLLLGASLVLTGCGSSTDLNPVNPAQAQTGGGNQVQVEFLARPGIAEALLFTNSNLATYNAVTPAFISRALTIPNGPEATAAAPVLAEAQAVLGLVTAGNANLSVAQAVGAFLPDVMRIDTTLNVAVAAPSYAAAVNAQGSPVGGRKLTDDTIDITLQVLTGNPAATDNVGYYPVAGNPNVGHHNLNGQTVQNGTATFPFLAEPN